MGFVPPNLYVNWVKRSLNRLLDAKLTIDGAPDAKYRTAVKSFQAYEGIKDDGIVGPKTQNHLIRANRNVGAYVDWVREVLRDTVPLPSVGSGRTMTSEDSEGVRQFQRLFGVAFGGLKDDGWVGAQTEMVMIILSGSVPPGDIHSPPPHHIFDDYIVHGDRQVTKEEIQALTWGLIGRKPGIAAFDRSEIVGTFAAALKAILSLASAYPPFDLWDIKHALGDPEVARFEVDVMKGTSYAIMDYATGIKRDSNELKTADLYGGASPEIEGGFERGYRKMHERLVRFNFRATPASKPAFEALARVPDKKRALKDIYGAVFAVYRNRGALGGEHANLVRSYNVKCIFDYSAIKVRCGPIGGPDLRLDL